MTRTDAIQALLGLILIVAGLAQVSLPAALVTPGAILLVLAVAPAWVRRR
jgi:hypothetical protein